MLCALLAAAPAGGDDYSGVRIAWAAARDAAVGDPAAALPRFDALVAAAPANNGVLRSAIATALAAHDTARLKRWLDRFVRQGGGLSDAARAAIRAEAGGAIVPSIWQAIEANSRALGIARVVARLPAGAHLIEGVAYDRRHGTLFASSVVDRVIFRIDADGAPEVAVALGEAAGSPMALFADAARGLLWAAVDGDPFGGDAPGSGGLLRISPRTGAHRLIPGPGGTPLHLGDVTVGPDGTAYGADSQSGAVYRCRPGCDRLELLVAPGRLRSAQGMAVAPDRRTLWVSDYSFGLLAVDLPTGELHRVGAAAGMALDGIDGMVLSGGRLIAVQNALAPARLIAITLDRSGRRALGLRVLARGGAAAAEPTQVARARGGAVLMVANSQWANYDSGPAGKTAQAETRIVRIAPERDVWAALMRRFADIVLLVAARRTLVALRPDSPSAQLRMAPEQEQRVMATNPNTTAMRHRAPPAVIDPRRCPHCGATRGDTVIKRGAITIVPDPLEVFWNGRHVPLSPTEAQVFRTIAVRGKASHEAIDRLLREIGSSPATRPVVMMRIRPQVHRARRRRSVRAARAQRRPLKIESDPHGSSATMVGLHLDPERSRRPRTSEPHSRRTGAMLAWPRAIAWRAKADRWQSIATPPRRCSAARTASSTPT